MALELPGIGAASVSKKNIYQIAIIFLLWEEDAALWLHFIREGPNGRTCIFSHFQFPHFKRSSVLLDMKYLRIINRWQTPKLSRNSRSASPLDKYPERNIHQQLRFISFPPWCPRVLPPGGQFCKHASSGVCIFKILQ